MKNPMSTRVYEQFHMYLENNGGCTSSKTRFERSLFMILHCKFEKQGLQEQLVLKEFGIKQNMRVMISFSNIPGEVKKKASCITFLARFNFPRELGRHLRQQCSISNIE